MSAKSAQNNAKACRMSLDAAHERDERPQRDERRARADSAQPPGVSSDSARAPNAAPEAPEARAADEPLLPRVARGDAGAIEACVDRYGGAIWNLSRRLCRNHADAEDASQEVFVELWRHAARYDSQSGGEWTFVLTVARRRLIDRLRRTSRRRDVGVGHAESSAATEATQLYPDDVAAPPEAAELREEAAVASAALERISPDQRDVLRLSVFEGLSYPEISEQLDMPLGTVKTHARRGLIKLRQLLGSSNPG